MNCKPVFIFLFFVVTGQAQNMDIYIDKKSGNYGFTRNDSIVIFPHFKKVDPFTGKFAWAKEKGKWGLIDKSGNWVLPAAYKQHVEEEENFNLVKKNGKYGLVDLKSGREVVSCLYKKPFFFEEFNGFGVASVVIKKRRAGLIDHAGNEKVACLYSISKTPFSEAAPRYYQVRQRKRMGLIDWKGKQIVPCQFDEVLPTDGDTTTISIKRKGKYGLYSTSGKVLVDCDYDLPFSMELKEYGIVRKKGKFGLVNRSGVLVIACQYAKDEEVITAFEKLKK